MALLLLAAVVSGIDASVTPRALVVVYKNTTTRIPLETIDSFVEQTSTGLTRREFAQQLMNRVGQFSVSSRACF